MTEGRQQGTDSASAPSEGATQTGATQTKIIVCPLCGVTIESDSRFVGWCDRCDWNVDPTPPAKKGRWTTRTERTADRATRHLFDRLSADPDMDSHSLPLKLFVDSVAVLVHLLTLALAAGVVLIALDGFGLASYVRVVLVVLLGAMVLYVQPFRYSKKKADDALYRSDAPHLFALTDAIAAAGGTKPVDRIRLEGNFNAHYSKPSRYPPTITIGLMLWSVLEPDEQVALLGHEFGHQLNGDLRRRRIVFYAIRTLRYWEYLVKPSAPPPWRSHMIARNTGAGIANLVERIVVPIVLIPLTLITQALGFTLQTLTNRQGARAEYYADELGARVAGSEAAVSLSEKMLIGPACGRNLTRQLRFDPELDPWLSLRQYAGTMKRKADALGRYLKSGFRV